MPLTRPPATWDVITCEEVTERSFNANGAAYIVRDPEADFVLVITKWQKTELISIQAREVLRVVQSARETTWYASTRLTDPC